MGNKEASVPIIVAAAVAALSLVIGVGWWFLSRGDRPVPRPTAARAGAVSDPALEGRRERAGVGRGRAGAAGAATTANTPQFGPGGRDWR